MTSLPGRLGLCWNSVVVLNDQGSFSHELGLQACLDINLVSQINEGAKAVVSLGHRWWRPLC